MGKLSRNKGANWERDFARILRERFPSLNVQRGVQSRFGGQEYADVIGVPGIHFELCHAVKVNYRAKLLQAIQDSKESGIPIVVAKDDRQAPVVYLKLDDFLDQFLTHYLACLATSESDAPEVSAACGSENPSATSSSNSALSKSRSGQTLMLLQQLKDTVEELTELVATQAENSK